MNYPVAERDKIVENCSKIGDQDRRSGSIVDGTVHRQAQLEFLVAEHGLESTDDVGHEAEALLEAGRCLGHHRGIKTNPHANGKAAAIAEPSQIYPRFIAVEQHRDRASRIQWNVKRPRDDVCRASGQHSEGRSLVRESAQHFHDSPVAAECKHGVVFVRVRPRDRRRVSGRFGGHGVATDPGVGKGLQGLAVDARSPS